MGICFAYGMFLEFVRDPRKGRLKATGFSPRVLHQENGCFHRSEKPNFHNYTFIMRLYVEEFSFLGNRCIVEIKGINVRSRVCVFTSERCISSESLAPPPADSAEHRQQLCQEYGFQQIGEPLPDNVTLRDIIDTLPKKVFEIDDVKAWKSVLVSVTSYALGIFMIAKAPWYLLPLAWAWTGTAITGFFVIGHDCAHKSFSRNKLVEDIVGTLAFLPLIYPYEPWRYKHDRHHAKTNMLVEDTAWQPINPEEFDSSPVLRKAIIYGYGPFRPWMSIAHCSDQALVKISLACVFAFMAIGWPLIIYKTGILGWIKFWLMPWLGYHFWMSTFTMVHHTAPHIPFKSSEEWNAAQAQLNGTVHCDYPSWIEVLCHDINVHIPHHISPRIPSYNLRQLINLSKKTGESVHSHVLQVLLLRNVYRSSQRYVWIFDEDVEEMDVVAPNMMKFCAVFVAFSRLKSEVQTWLRMENGGL
ncbi:UNVERIFIED_CONTAM: Omega-6 fatty acid desaturase, chloroplastic [Sesamum calycinum]|uniref:Omega-6 fatty acid desaturase, chloroplastic n=1 Tax=Sesamum calycinum TaxID=2727403 RepID=A0AAW2N3V2_9LAMI